KGLAACNSQTASPFGCLNNFYFRILSNFLGSLQGHNGGYYARAHRFQTVSRKDSRCRRVGIYKGFQLYQHRHAKRKQSAALSSDVVKYVQHCRAVAADGRKPV
uniref:hypothetical protein n=1 Tax=Gemmiger formicilis TaxID=745368 RepID=UPI004027FD30